MLFSSDSDQIFNLFLQNPFIINYLTQFDVDLLFYTLRCLTHSFIFCYNSQIQQIVKECSEMLKDQINHKKNQFQLYMQLYTQQQLQHTNNDQNEVQDQIQFTNLFKECKELILQLQMFVQIIQNTASEDNLIEYNQQYVFFVQSTYGFVFTYLGLFSCEHFGQVLLNEENQQIIACLHKYLQNYLINMIISSKFQQNNQLFTQIVGCIIFLFQISIPIDRLVEKLIYFQVNFILYQSDQQQLQQVILLLFKTSQYIEQFQSSMERVFEHANEEFEIQSSILKIILAIYSQKQQFILFKEKFLILLQIIQDLNIYYSYLNFIQEIVTNNQWEKEIHMTDHSNLIMNIIQTIALKKQLNIHKHNQEHQQSKFISQVREMIAANESPQNIEEELIRIQNINDENDRQQLITTFSQNLKLFNILPQFDLKNQFSIIEHISIDPFISATDQIKQLTIYFIGEYGKLQISRDQKIHYLCILLSIFNNLTFQSNDIEFSQNYIVPFIILVFDDILYSISNLKQNIVQTTFQALVINQVKQFMYFRNPQILDLIDFITVYGVNILGYREIDKQFIENNYCSESILERFIKTGTSVQIYSTFKNYLFEFEYIIMLCQYITKPRMEETQIKLLQIITEFIELYICDRDVDSLEQLIRHMDEICEREIQQFKQKIVDTITNINQNQYIQQTINYQMVEIGEALMKGQIISNFKKQRYKTLAYTYYLIIMCIELGFGDYLDLNMIQDEIQ